MHSIPGTDVELQGQRTAGPEKGELKRVLNQGPPAQSLIRSISSSWEKVERSLGPFHRVEWESTPSKRNTGKKISGSRARHRGKWRALRDLPVMSATAWPSHFHSHTQLCRKPTPALCMRCPLHDPHPDSGCHPLTWALGALFAYLSYLWSSQRACRIPWCNSLVFSNCQLPFK